MNTSSHRRSLVLQLAPRLATLLSIAAISVATISTYADEPVLPPISEGGRFVEQDGAKIYGAICQSCHMPQGQGAQGAGMYPALAKNPRLAASGYLVYNVVQGRRGMPGFGVYLSDTQVAAVANYVRTNMGNSYTDPVSAADVVKLR